MTKFKMTALAAPTLAAATLAIPALASAAPDPIPDSDLIPITFDATSELNSFGFKEISFTCSNYFGDYYPYLAFDSNIPPLFQSATYFTGDGESIGHYLGDLRPLPTGEDGINFTGANVTLSPEHQTVRFFCAKTKQAANQKG